MTILGTGLAGATAVTFGSTAASSFLINSATSITAVAPEEPAGQIAIQVTTPAGTSSAAKTNYTVTPTVTGVSPASESLPVAPRRPSPAAGSPLA